MKNSTTISANEFMRYLQENDLVIAPVDLVQPDVAKLRAVMLKKPSLTYREISQCRIWGNITQKRAYQIAKAEARPGEIIKPGGSENSKEKILTAAVKRIAMARGEMTVNEYRDAV